MRPALLAGLSLLLAACGAPPLRPVPVVPIVAIAAADPPLPSDPDPRAGADREGAVTGIGKAHLGQTAAEVRALFGPESRTVSHDEERQGWIDAGYQPDQSIPFLQGFEQILVYDDPPPSSDPPLWKLYLRNDRVMYIVASAYGSEERPTTRTSGFPPGCFLLGPEAGIKKTFGEPDAVVPDSEHEHTTYHFLAAGISVIAAGGQIRVFDIFGPLDEDRRDRYRRILGDAGKAAKAAKP